MIWKFYQALQLELIRRHNWWAWETMARSPHQWVCWKFIIQFYRISTDTWVLETVYVKHVMRGCIYYTAVVSKKVRQQYIYIYKDPVKPGFHRKRNDFACSCSCCFYWFLACFYPLSLIPHFHIPARNPRTAMRWSDIHGWIEGNLMQTTWF